MTPLSSPRKPGTTDRKELIELEARCAQLSANNEALKQEHSREVARLRQLLQKSALENKRLEGVKRENALLSARLTQLEQAHAESALEAQLADLKSANEVLHLAAQRTWSLEKSLRDAHGELDRMARERDALVAERNAMQHRSRPPSRNPIPRPSAPATAWTANRHHLSVACCSSAVVTPCCRTTTRWRIASVSG